MPIAPCCPRCGQTLPPKLALKAPLSPWQWRIVERVHAAGKNGIFSDDLFDFAYCNDPDGGPVGGRKTLAQRIHWINKKLKLDGKEIRAPKGGPGTPTAYVLKDIGK